MSAVKSLKAFTLIELLVVVAIIALLVGILVPAVQQAQDMAKNGVVQTQLHAISVGLEMFRQDNLAGRGQYADSYYESPVTGERFSGYVSLGIQLVGRDLRGYDVADLYDNSVDEIRRDPYIKLETTEIIETNPGGSTDELEPVLLCKWGEPILYFRATPGARATDDINYTYATSDVSATLNGIAAEVLPSGTNHSEDPLVYFPSGNVGGSLFLAYPNFYNAIRNEDVSVGVTPHNVDSFILWSAGKDRIYGTDDDVTNF